MTIIVVKGGMMAVDSLVSDDGGRVVGYVQKWRAVPDERGGGFIATTGPVGVCSKAMDDFLASETDMPKDVTAVHLRADGTVWTSDGGPWYNYFAEFYAEGYGRAAVAAMMAGASAKEAAQIVCRLYPGVCGGEIHVLSVI